MAKQSINQAIINYLNSIPEGESASVRDIAYANGVECGEQLVQKAILNDPRIFDFACKGKISVTTRHGRLPSWYLKIENASAIVPCVSLDQRMVKANALAITGNPHVDAMNVKLNEAKYGNKFNPKKFKNFAAFTSGQIQALAATADSAVLYKKKFESEERKVVKLEKEVVQLENQITQLEGINKKLQLSRQLAEEAASEAEEMVMDVMTRPDNFPASDSGSPANTAH